MDRPTSKKAYTPGPWVQESDITDERPIAGADGSTVAVTIGVGFPDTMPGRTDANANLISAAPELLEALETVLHLVEGCRDDWNYNASDKQRKLVDRALAKARGENEE